MTRKIPARPKSVKKVAILKRCECGASYDLAGWLALKRVGLQLGIWRDSACELRNCSCGSTISVAFHILRCPCAMASAEDAEMSP